MRFRIIAFVTSVILLVISVWWFGFHGVHPALILNPPPIARTHHPQLDAIESIDVENANLKSILDELAAKHGFRYEIDTLGGNFVANAISLQMHDVTLRALLNQVAREANPEWEAIDAGDHIRLIDRDTWFATEANYVSRFYPIAPGLSLSVVGGPDAKADFGGAAGERLEHLVQEIFFPEHWELTGGGHGTVTRFPHGILVTTTPDVHRLIADFLAWVLAEDPVDADQGTLEPIRLAGNATDARDAELEKKLATKVDFALDGASWLEVQQWLASDHALPVRLGTNGDDWGVDLPGGKYSCNYSQITIQEGLDFLVDGLECDVRGEVVWIEQLDESAMQHQLHPVGDVLQSTDWEGSNLADLVVKMIAPETWDEVGGEGVCRIVGDYLAVRQPWRVQRRVAALLGQLRAEQVPPWFTPHSSGKAVQESPLANRLQQPATFDIQEASVREVANYLRDEFDIPAVMHDSIEEIGIGESRIFTLQAKVPSLWQGLDKLGWYGLGWRVVGENLLLVSAEESELRMVCKVYRLPAPLLAPDELAGGGRGRNAEYSRLSTLEFQDELVDLIVNTVEPDSWDESGGPGALHVVDDCLVLSASYAIHQRVAQLLRALEIAQASSTTEVIPVTCDRQMHQTFHQQMESVWSVENAPNSLQELLDVIQSHLDASLVLLDDGYVDVEGRWDKQLLLPSDSDLLAEFAATETPLHVVLRSMFCEYRHTYRDGILWMERAGENVKNEVCIYPVDDLRQKDPELLDEIVDRISNLIDQGTWYAHGGFGAIERFRGSLVVATNSDTQRKIRGLLAALREIAANPQDRQMRHVNANVGEIDKGLLKALQQPAKDPASAAVIERLLPAADPASLEGLSLWVALQSQCRPKQQLASYGRQVAFLPQGEAGQGLYRQLAIFPVSDLLARYEPGARPDDADGPWYLLGSAPPYVGGKAAGMFGLPETNDRSPISHPAEPFLRGFIQTQFQYPWHRTRPPVPQFSLLGDNLFVLADLASLWEVERIVQRLRDAMQPGVALELGLSCQSLQAVTSFQFEGAPLDAILQELERQVEFPIRKDSSVADLGETCQGQGSADQLPLVDAFQQLKFTSAGGPHDLVLSPTPEAILVKIQRPSKQYGSSRIIPPSEDQPPPQRWLQVYDIRDLEANHPKLNLVHLNELVTEVGCDCFTIGLFGVISSHVDCIRGFMLVWAPTSAHAEVAELLELLRMNPALLELLTEDGTADLPACVAWLEQALAGSGATVERRLAIWLMGQIQDDAVQPLVLRLSQDPMLWQTSISRDLLHGTMQRLGTRAAPLVSGLLAHADPKNWRPGAREALVSLVASCTNQPVEDMAQLLAILSRNSENNKALVKTIGKIGELKEKALPLVDNLVSLFTVDPDQQRDVALRATLLALDPVRTTVARAIERWQATHELSTERASEFKTERWLPNGRIEGTPVP